MPAFVKHDSQDSLATLYTRAIPLLQQHNPAVRPHEDARNALKVLTYLSSKSQQISYILTSNSSICNPPPGPLSTKKPHFVKDGQLVSMHGWDFRHHRVLRTWPIGYLDVVVGVSHSSLANANLEASKR